VPPQTGTLVETRICPRDPRCSSPGYLLPGPASFWDACSGCRINDADSAVFWDHQRRGLTGKHFDLSLLAARSRIGLLAARYPPPPALVVPCPVVWISGHVNSDGPTSSDAVWAQWRRRRCIHPTVGMQYVGRLCTRRHKRSIPRLNEQTDLPRAGTVCGEAQMTALPAAVLAPSNASPAAHFPGRIKVVNLD
jgi:hypothetical protein